MLGDLQFKEEQQERARRSACVRFLKRGLEVIYSQQLLKELEIDAGLGSQIDVNEYCIKMTAALQSRASQMYGAPTLNSCIHEARIDYAEFGAAR